HGGIPVAQSIEIIGNTINNILYKEIFNKISQDIKSGMNLSDSIIQYSNYFPELVPQMIAVGEQTGQLDKILQKIADFYAREADTIVSNLTDLIQPFLMIGVGILVGLLFASILIPIYNLGGAIGAQ
ncbi:MAG: type II secretion system F family protein, partial [bacterium]|nr:type II secretion system F family protein [bacterium]